MKNILFLICAAVLIISGCSSIKTISLSNYSGQISFFDNTSEYYSGDKIMKCKLSDTTTLNGYKCISWIWFFENGQIKQFETAEDIKMNNFVIPSNSTVFLNEQKPNKIKYIWFSKDVIINNVGCKGGGKISTEFYDNDSLKACFLTSDQNLQGFSCLSSLLKPVYFYPTGKIKILTLSIDSKFADTVYKNGESIIVGEDGIIRKFER
jgi:hypothetical protein